MNAAPSTPPAPAEKRFRSLKHSKTFTSLSDSIRSLRDSETPPDVPSTPRSRDTSKSSLFQFAQNTIFEGDKFAPSSSPFSSHSIYTPSRASFSASVRNDDSPRSPRQRLQAFTTLTGSPRSSERPAPSRSGASRDEQQPPPFLQQRAISSPVPQSTRTARDDLQSSPIVSHRNGFPSNILPALSLSSTQDSSSSASPPSVATPRPSSARVDNITSTEPEATSLIAAAGSTQAAILQLVKDKQAALTRSDQLWRLVEQQREMIVGLNRDLEAALQEKERYRKKLKEQIVLSGNGQPSEDSDSTYRPSLNDVQEEPRSRSREIDKLVVEKGFVGGGTRQHALPLTPVSPETPLRSTPPSIPAREDLPKVSMALGTSSPQAYGAPDNQKAVSPVEKARKAPPKPLDLSQTQRTQSSTPLDQSAIDSGSEYGDVDAKDSPAQLERGRRKTRDDDDREREALAMEQERLNRFEKLKQSKSTMQLLQKNVPAPLVMRMPSYRGVDNPPILGSGLGLPSSPRAPLNAALQSPQTSSFGSIGSVMTTGHPALAQIREQTLQAPLMSPGLPLSPRPGDRPMNAPQPRMPLKAVRSLASIPTQQISVGLPSSPRNPPPTVVIPQPQAQSPVTSMRTVVDGLYHHQIQQPTQKTAADIPSPPNASPEKADLREASPVIVAKQPQIFRGFTSEQYPNLLLPPNALVTVDVKVDSCRLMPLRGIHVGLKDSEEETPFTLAVCSRNDGRQLWRVQKTLPGLHMVDQGLRICLDLEAKFPEKSLFSGQAPAKIDARREALHDYFQGLLNTSPMDERTALLICGFLSTDVLPPNEPVSSDVDSGVAVGLPKRKKEGYLSKKGKSLGGWKARYFILDGPDLQYFEALGGVELGMISLRDAQIARQTTIGNSESLEYRHAFMIMEQKRKESKDINRHILCAETDEERDAWIDALLPYTEPSAEEEQMSPTLSMGPSLPMIPKPVTNKALAEVKSGKPLPKNAQDLRRPPMLQTISYDSTAPAESPVLGGGSARASWSPTSADNVSDSGSQVSSHASIGAQGAALAASSVAQSLPKKSPAMAKKKRSIFGFRNKVVEENVPPSPQVNGLFSNGDYGSKQRESSVRTVFGIPLAEAAEFCAPRGIDICLPAPVYRCIEYLEQKRAAQEEGIFRLSGSTTAIKALKERFNAESDIKLLDGQPYDIHTVASLLKLYLRELPESILTRKLHLDFLHIIDSDDEDKKKVFEISLLIRKLPEANIELIATLSRFLIDIVNNADLNRMSIRNVGIVFSPTLNIPAQLISFFLTDYGAIFGSTNDSSSAPASLKLAHTTSLPSPLSPASPDSLRSPYKQLFSDAPRPVSNTSYVSNGVQSLPRRFDGYANGPKPEYTQRDRRTSFEPSKFVTLKEEYSVPLASLRSP